MRIQDILKEQAADQPTVKYTGRETRDGIWRVFKSGQAAAVAGPFKSAEQATAWIAKQKKVGS
jgi:hypothetical protein